MTRTLMRYDPIVGTLFTPNLKLRVAGEKGGHLVRTNAAGFRSEREFTTERIPGKFRAIMFGDSQTAGETVSNKQRFSDLLERNIPDLEVYNYGIGATGPDQHFLTYQHRCDVEHDLVVIVVYTENIRRICRRLVASRAADGSTIFYAKPYFEMSNGNLEVRNVPVPKQTWSEQTLPEEFKPHVYSFYENSLFATLTGTKRLLPRLPKFLGPMREFIRIAAARAPGVRMLPEYNTSRNPGWLLLRAILENWVHASSKPVLIVTIPHYITFVSGGDPTRYRARFRELIATTGCHYYDFLPDVLKLPTAARRKLWSDWSNHLTPSAHELLAERLTPVVQSLIREAQRTPNRG